MKERFCSNCGEKLKGNANFCVECGQQVSKSNEEKSIDIDNEIPAAHKSPWAAAILNFFIPGVGFIYLGTIEFILIGVTTLVIMLLSMFSTGAEEWLSIESISWSIILAFVFATFGYIAAEWVNKKKRFAK